MITIEDADFAEFSLTEGDIAVPVEIFLAKGSTEPQITVYEPFKADAEEFLSRYGNDPFSGDAIAFWRERLTAPMKDYGLSPTKDADTFIRIFTLSDAAFLNRERILPNTHIVSGQDDLASMQNLTTHDLEMDAEDPDDISAIAIAEGKIAAYATLNDAVFGEDEMEISVECAPAFRGCGLASSCVAALSGELLRRGYTVSYKCRSRNIASARVAEKAGFRETGKSYSFVCYRNL